MLLILQSSSYFRSHSDSVSFPSLTQCRGVAATTDFICPTSSSTTFPFKSDWFLFLSVNTDIYRMVILPSSRLSMIDIFPEAFVLYDLCKRNASMAMINNNQQRGGWRKSHKANINSNTYLPFEKIDVCN